MKSDGATIQMDYYFPMVSFIMLSKMVLTFEFLLKSWNVTIQLKATEQYFFRWETSVFFVIYYVSRARNK